MPRIVDWPGRMREVAEFVGLGQAELAVIQTTAPVILDHGPHRAVENGDPVVEQLCQFRMAHRHPG